MIKYLFLDIDGVLNDERQVHRNGSRGIDPGCVRRLNRIIHETDPWIVVSSAWRRHVLENRMTLEGFEHLLMSHGVDCESRVWDTTGADDPRKTRGDLINDWLCQNAYTQVYRYVILDDGNPWQAVMGDHGMHAAGHGPYFVQTSYSGLSDADVERAIAILNRETPHGHPRRRRNSGDHPASRPPR